MLRLQRSKSVFGPPHYWPGYDRWQHLSISIFVEHTAGWRLYTLYRELKAIAAVCLPSAIFEATGWHDDWEETILTESSAANDA